MNFLTMSLDFRPKWQLPFCKSGVHQFLNITNKFQFPVGHILLRRLALCVIGGGHPLLPGIDGGDNSLFQMHRPGPTMAADQAARPGIMKGKVDTH